MEEETTLFSGNVFVGNYSSKRFEETLIVQGSTITFVGAREHAVKFLDGKKHTEVQITGMLIPGFQDAHVHPFSAGIMNLQCNMYKATGLDHALDIVRSYAAANKDLEWIAGCGYRKYWFPNCIALASELDKAISDRPCVITCSDGHSVWCNTLAMKMKGITSATPDPKHGMIARHPNGEPTGSFMENAQIIFGDHLESGVFADNLNVSAKRRTEGLREGLNNLVKYGITSFQDAIVRPGNLEIYRSYFADESNLRPRASLCLWVEPLWTFEQQFSWIMKEREKEVKNRMRINSVKFMLDGVVETHTAYMKESYCCHPGIGVPNFTFADLNKLVCSLDKEGVQIHVHAIGDQAITEALDAVEHAQTKNDVEHSKSLRHHIAHIQVPNPADLPRFKKLGVCANFQPLWSVPDEDMKLYNEPTLGEVRKHWQYPIKTLVESGAHVGFGSDWFVTSLNPLDCIQVAVTHKQIGHPTQEAWNPKEIISLDEALSIYTKGSAYINFLDDRTGTLEVGKEADLAILDKNLFELDPTEIHKAKVECTYIAGKEVYRRSK
eukprot:TRINITY_DN5956_c0_g1_i2.p1 TRINITY_DN5956_c0_g1~~TRINITY_DN5956_c0_g1_i2.p1  ORF type:complete len:552 (-),score=140.38 TRINITY_DN5956_c0_g1_i2:60-1715(-)